MSIRLRSDARLPIACGIQAGLRVRSAPTIPSRVRTRWFPSRALVARVRTLTRTSWAALSLPVYGSRCADRAHFRCCRKSDGSLGVCFRNYCWVPIMSRSCARAKAISMQIEHSKRQTISRRHLLSDHLPPIHRLLTSSVAGTENALRFHLIQRVFIAQFETWFRYPTAFP